MIPKLQMFIISFEVNTHVTDADRTLFLLASRKELYLCLEGDNEITNTIITSHPQYISWLISNSKYLLDIPKSEWWNDRIDPYHRYDEFFHYLEEIKEIVLFKTT